MTENIDTIPDDLSACQELLRAVLVRLRDLERQLDEFVATTEELERSYACLKEEYLALKRLLFGPRRERMPEAAGQLHLFDADVPPVSPRSNQPIPRQPRNRPRASQRRGTAAGQFPTICPGRQSSMMFPRKPGSAIAAARRRGSARM